MKMHSKACQCPEYLDETEWLEEEANQLAAQRQFEEGYQYKPITYKLTSELVQVVKEEIQCYAVAFNHEGTLMAATQNNEIKLWEFESGILKSIVISLSGHTKTVTCLIFSKKSNWFVSGSFDDTIRCWQEKGKNKWVSTRSQTTSSSSCLVLNKHEDQLLSCGLRQDHSIKIWKVDCILNILTYNYSLEKHTDSVACFSLNDSETSLVSCSFDKIIIIWEKENQSQWKFKYYITQSVDDWGNRISFINDNVIAWQQNAKAMTGIFTLQNGIFKERLDLQVALKNAEADSMLWFPSVYLHHKITKKWKISSRIKAN